MRSLLLKLHWILGDLERFPFSSAVALEDGRPAKDQGPVRGAGEQRRSAARESELAAEGVRHPEVELHEAEEAPSAVQETQNRAAHVRAARHRSEALRSLQRGGGQQRLQPR